MKHSPHLHRDTNNSVQSGRNEITACKNGAGGAEPQKKKKNEKTTFVFVARQLEGETERGGEERETTGCSG